MRRDSTVVPDVLEDDYFVLFAPESLRTYAFPEDKLSSLVLRRDDSAADVQRKLRGIGRTLRDIHRVVHGESRERLDDLLPRLERAVTLARSTDSWHDYLQRTTPPSAFVSPTAMSWGAVTTRDESRHGTVFLTHRSGARPLTAKVMQHPAWAVPVSPEHTVGPSESCEIELVLDQRFLSNGSYSEDLVITTNDPEQPEVRITISVTIQRPFPVLVVYTEQVALGNVSRRADPVSQIITLENKGSAPWHGAFQHDEPWIITGAPIRLGPGERRSVAVSVDASALPDQPGEHVGSLTITSDSSDRVTIPVTVWRLPDLSVYPESLPLGVLWGAQGDPMYVYFTVTNDSEGALSVHVHPEPDYVRLDPTTVEVQPGTSHQITCMLRPYEFQPGQFSIAIHVDGHDRRQTIPLTFDVVEHSPNPLATSTFWHTLAGLYHPWIAGLTAGLLSLLASVFVLMAVPFPQPVVPVLVGSCVLAGAGARLLSKLLHIAPADGVQISLKPTPFQWSEMVSCFVFLVPLLSLLAIVFDSTFRTAFQTNPYAFIGALVLGYPIYGFFIDPRNSREPARYRWRSLGAVLIGGMLLGPVCACWIIPTALYIQAIILLGVAGVWLLTMRLPGDYRYRVETPDRGGVAASLALVLALLLLGGSALTGQSGFYGSDGTGWCTDPVGPFISGVFDWIATLSRGS